MYSQSYDFYDAVGDVGGAYPANPNNFIPPSPQQQQINQQQAQYQQEQQQQQRTPPKTTFPSPMPQPQPRMASSSPLSPNDLFNDSLGSNSQLQQFDLNLLNDRFRLLGSMTWAILFHWMIVFAIVSASQFLHNFGSFEFTSIFNRSVFWHTFTISLYVGIIVGLFSRQVEWSRLHTMDEINKPTLYLNLSTATYFMINLILSLALATTYLGLYNGGYTTKLNCSGTESCLNDKYLFVLFSTFYTTGSYYINFRKTKQYRLQFPDTSQSLDGKLLHYCGKYFVESSKFVLGKLPLTYLTYYFMGTTFRLWASKSTNLHLGVNLLETFSQFLSIELFIYVFLASTFTVGTFILSWEIFQLCMTKRRIFPVEYDSFMTNDDGVTLLSDALKTTTAKNHYMRNLAYFDLFTMTEYREGRAELIFKIGYKAGNIMVWSLIREECLSAIRGSTDLIKTFITSEEEMGKKLFSDSRKSDENQQKGKVSPQPKVSIMELEPSSLTVRRRSYYPTRQVEASPVKFQIKKPTPLQIFLRGHFTTEKIRPILSKKVRESSWLEFYFKKKLDVQVSMLLADSQVVLFSLKCLMNFVRVYIREQYANVVQRDLAVIIGTFIELYETMDLLKKVDIPRKSSLLIIEDRKSNTVLKRNSDLRKIQEHISTACTNALVELHFHFHEYFEFMPISFENLTKLRTIISNNNCFAESSSKNSR